MEIEDAFRVHLLNQDGLTKAGIIAQAFDRLLNELREIVPVPAASFESLRMVERLMEANYWAKRSIAVIPENQVETGKPLYIPMTMVRKDEP